MALHSVGDDLLTDWDDWSRQCPEKHGEAVCAAKWKTFRRGGGVGVGSLIFWAQQDKPGWQPPHAKAESKKTTANGTAGTENSSSSEQRRLDTTALTMIKPEPVSWLVPGQLPLGKLVLIAGAGGLGKSSITLDLAAALTRGRAAFGLEYEAAPPGEVLLITCEDDYADTVVPRLLAAGADLGRIHRVNGLQPEKDKPTDFSLAHYLELENELKARPGVRLVVIDPAGAYVGRTGVDDHKDSALRSLLGPLSELAARCRVTIVLIKHVNKGVTAKAVDRVTGSVAYVNTVRAAFVVCPDKDDDELKLFLPLKFNLGPKPQGLSYRTEPLHEDEAHGVLTPFTHLKDDDRRRLAEQLFRIGWQGPVEIDADEAMAAAEKKDKEPNKVARAAQWLQEFLAKHAYPSDEVFKAGEHAGFTKDNVYKAKEQLGDAVRASNRGSFRGKWH
jgi:hypothetical protein